MNTTPSSPYRPSPNLSYSDVLGRPTPDREPSARTRIARANATMERYANGDEAAFEELYALLAPRVYRLCIHLSGGSDADELQQEVFLKLHRSRTSFLPDGSVLAWAYAIARTTHLDRIRRCKRRPEAPLQLARLEREPAPAGSDPESSTNQRALESVLEAELAKLTESLRAAYVLVKLEGLSSAEAASALGLSTSAVKQRVHRASESLKSALQQAGW